jgi:hypothetical protein
MSDHALTNEHVNLQFIIVASETEWQTLLLPAGGTRMIRSPRSTGCANPAFD